MDFRSIRKAMEPDSLVSRRNEVVPSARVRVRESTIVTVGNLGAFAFGLAISYSCPFRKSYPHVLMMQSSQDGDGDEDARPLDWSMQRRILL
jgi:hypothetical protein